MIPVSRNEIPLPDELPVCLRPSNLRHSVIDRHNKDLYTGAGAAEPLLDTSQDTATSDPGDRTAATQDLSPGSQVGHHSLKIPCEKPININKVSKALGLFWPSLGRDS